MAGPRQILVIDDEPERLDQLVSSLASELEDIQVTRWVPTPGDDPVASFEDHLQTPTGLIVTDHDLTKGVTGLLGSSITAWSQQRFIPVCNFSRKPRSKLPRESNFFELKVPTEPDEDRRARFISRIYRGFQALRGFIEEHHRGDTPAAALLAGAMGHPELQDDLAPYITSVGSASSSFLQTLRQAGEMPARAAQTDFQAFVLGHVLVNGVLEFPGPILPLPTLVAYCALGPSVSNEVAGAFESASYTGPFSLQGSYFVRNLVDEQIDDYGAGLDRLHASPTEVDEYNRAIITRVIGSEARHDCSRCDGERGGLWCPFTRRAVCTRDDCSVTSATWIPRGATLCRVERDYHDEWAPLLGE